MEFNGKVLVVVDMQNDFVTGALGSVAALNIVMNVRDKIKKAHEDGALVFYTMDTHFEDYLDTLEGKKLPIPHCILGTEGWALHPVIHGVKTSLDFTIEKSTFGAVELPEIIDDFIPYNEQKHDFCELKEIEVCGLCTDICVMNNVALLRAYFPDTIIKVDRNACAGTSAANHDAALMTMKSLQIDVI